MKNETIIYIKKTRSNTKRNSEIIFDIIDKKGLDIKRKSIKKSLFIWYFCFKSNSFFYI